MTDIISTVDWSRWQFALTACYHWLFVPLTLGLSVIVAVMESIYLKKGRPDKWLKLTKLWMSLFAINFVCGIATGIILEFEFGTNWSNYSWFVGDIFGAPLAIEGLFAFFLEATFVVVMLFGWKRVSPGFHLTATWLTAIGTSLSALWILVANAWMQYPVGMEFNPDTMRNEMSDFWAVALSPVAMNKFFHTVMSGWALSGCFVLGVSGWLAAFGKRCDMAVPSMKVGGWVGLVGIILTMAAGHGSILQVSKSQPMKFAALEGVWKGSTNAELTAFGLVNPAKKLNNTEKPFIFKVGAPGVLSWATRGSSDAFIPGIEDIIAGRDIIDGKEVNTVSYAERILRGKLALQALADYGETHSDEALQSLRENYEFFGYGYYDNPAELIPPVGMTYYAYHIMVAGGMYMLLILAGGLLLAYYRPDTINKKWWAAAAMLALVVSWIVSQSGWVCAEVGRQPWVIQNLMPTRAAISAVSPEGVKTTFWAFAVVFTTLLAAEISIMINKIRQVARK